ncbi:MAG: sulfatase-like hydrolase/transferase [Acutalibacteraceae bacterium]|nr:sulfatase-like hydrolase/transferase [Acutalibacteraceae bacterium]
MENKFSLDTSMKKVLPMLLAVIGVVLAAVLLITRLNLINLVCLLYCCIMSAVILLSLIIKKKVYAPMIFGYAASSVGIIIFHIIFGADAGFGAFLSDKMNGWSSAANTLFTGDGSFITRLGGNMLLALPAAVCLWALFFVAKKKCSKTGLKAVTSFLLSILLMASSVFSVLFGNHRTKPVTERLWDGHDDYLKNVDKKTSDNPNVLFILMDDMGYGDTSLNGAIYETPNMDSVGENGLNFENFYSGYSVCSPARFATLTGRYPYRGYADNVIYPTVQTTGNFAQTRVYNSFEMGNNVDGMLGDEITIAEVFQNAGYATGAFGKWHLGDYGEYLPTNQGFDYFYGSHHVNDMYAFYHVREEGGEYEVVHGNQEMRDEKGKKDQSMLTEWIHGEIEAWITDKAEKDEPFFAYYATPWPHGPVFAGDDFDGTSGMGTYVDCLTEFDTYLGKLFNTMEELGVLEDTIIVFTSDNGPALEGSVGDLRGGKYLAYEGGQKVPFMLRWDNNNGLFEKGGTRSESVTSVDFFPTLIELCGITGKDGTENYLPSDREMDGVSMLPVITEDKVIHTKENPILHMKREDVKAIQYTVTADSVKQKYPDYNYAVLNDNENITFKYFDKIQNDNSAFWDKNRKNWLHILSDDYQENYNRTSVYPEISDEMNEVLKGVQNKLKENRRGIIE